MKYRLHVLAVLLVASLVAIFLVMRADGRRKAGGPVQSDGGSTSSQTDGTAAVRLLIYDASDRRPIEGAAIAFGRGSDGVQVRTDAEGRASLPAVGRGRLGLTATGYVGFQQSFDARPGEYSFPIWRAGTCEFLATDLQGGPVEGVEIELLPPPIQGFVHPTPARTSRTGRDGRAIWPFLVPGAGYAWKVVSDHADGLRKADDHPHVHRAENGHLIVKPTKDPAVAFKGTFSVNAGEQVKVPLCIAMPTSVRGIVVDSSGNPVEGASLKLYHRTTMGGGYTSFDMEKGSKTGLDGRFEFRAVLPGSGKRLQVQWLADGKYSLGRVIFDLSPGENKDLGPLSANGPHTVHVKIAFEPESALTPEARAACAQAQGLLTICNLIPGTSDRDRILDTFPVRLGEEFSLAGLHDGSLSVQLETGLKHLPLRASFQDPSPVSISLPGPSSVRLVFKVTALDAPIRVRASVPPEAKRASFRFCAVRKSGGQVMELGRVQPKDGFVEASGDVPAGDYEVWIVPYGPNSEGSSPNLFGRASAVVAGGQQNDVQVNLVAGAILRGRLLDEAGNPVQHVVVFGKVTVDGIEAQGQVYAALTNAAGEFSMTGVIPGAVLWSLSQRPASGGDSVRVGAAGSETWVDLVRLKRF